MARPLVVITGGEPSLQLLQPDGVKLLGLLDGVQVAIETNGTRDLVQLDLDHITVSPKLMAAQADGPLLAHVRQREGTDLKVVWPVDNEVCEQLIGELGELGRGFDHRFLQPRDDGSEAQNQANLDATVRWASRLGWRVSLQAHKLVGWP